MIIILSEHSIQQGYKRLQINSDDLNELCHSCIIHGIHRENLRPRLRNKVKKVINTTINNGCKNPFVRIYDKKIFVFEYKQRSAFLDEYKLITFFNIDMCDKIYYSMIK
jgi:hypothetical protein